VGGDLVFYSDRDNIETLRLQYSGKVNIPNGNLALSSGATITDGTNDRINFGHNETSILDESGQKSINVNSSNKLDIRTRGYPIRIEDTTNSQDIAVFSEGGNISIPSGDLTDGANVIYDQSASEIPDSAMGSISNSTLTNSSITVNGGTDISGGSASLGGSLTIDHADTSTQGNVSAGAGAAITDINLDGRGHTTSISTTDFDSRFVLESGDTMSGTLTMDNSDIHFDNGAVQISRTSTSVGSGALFLEGHNGVTLHSNDTNKDLLNAYDTGNVEIPNGNLEMGSGAIQTSNFEVEENSSTNSLDFNYTG